MELPTIVDERKEEAILLTTVATAMLYELDRLVNLVKEVLEYADTIGGGSQSCNQACCNKLAAVFCLL